MSWHESFATRQSGKGRWLVVSAVGFSLGIILSYNYLYKPFVKRKRYKEAENFANYIYEIERKKLSKER